MRQALVMARRAGRLGEVPVGCVVVRDGEIIAQEHNAPIATNDPTGHAEVRALRKAGRVLGNYRLPECDLYVTLEPCAMCAGAMVHGRIGRLIFGATDPRTGACGSTMDLVGPGYGNHQLDVTAGVLADESAQLLREFFKQRR